MAVVKDGKEKAFHIIMRLLLAEYILNLELHYYPAYPGLHHYTAHTRDLDQEKTDLEQFPRLLLFVLRAIFFIVTSPISSSVIPPASITTYVFRTCSSTPLATS